MSFFGLLTRTQSPAPASHEQAVAAFLKEQTLRKTRKDVAEQLNAPSHQPLRGSIALASGPGGLGRGVPVQMSDGTQMTDGTFWRLRAKDFCRSPPAELGLPIAKVGEGTGVPGPEDCFCPTNSLMPRFRDPKGFGRRAPANSLPGLPYRVRTWAKCQNESYVTYQCSRFPLLPPRMPIGTAPSVAAAAVSGGIDVYVATSDHFGHGLFALMERVLNQIHHARVLGMEPYVHLGAYPWMEPQACEYARSIYYTAAHGENAWEYWFTQPGGYRLGAATAQGRWVRSLQTSAVEIVTTQGPVTAYGRTDYYDHDRLGSSRQVAHDVLGELGEKLVRPKIRTAALELFATWRRRSAHVMGVHLRGTDKVVRRKVPPHAYFPFMEAYLATHADALFVVATDDQDYLQRILARFGPETRLGGAEGRVLRRVQTQLYVRDPFGEGGRRGGYLKGEDVLIDALLLAQCDFLLKSASAVAEFALWVRPFLRTRHLDLQVVDRFATQPLPQWLRKQLGADRRSVAAVFCETLARACANETAPKYGGAKYCNHCEPEKPAAALPSRPRARWARSG